MADKIIDAEYEDIDDMPEVQTEGFGARETETLSPIFQRVMQSYEDGAGSADWLTKKLAEELPDKTPEEISRLGQEIQSGVHQWNEDVSSINAACEDGQTKEEWFADRMQENADGVETSQYGDYLASLDASLHQANQAAMAAAEGNESELPLPKAVDMADEVHEAWDEENTRAMAKHLGQEVAVSGMAGMVLRTGWRLAEASPLGENLPRLEKVEEALRSGDDEGVKQAASAALTVGVAQGKVPFLPKNTPVPVLSGMACYGVDQAKIMLQYADGEIGAEEVVEATGRLATVHASNACGGYCKKLGMAVGAKVGSLVGAVCPVLAPVGMAVGGFIGGTIGKLAGSKIGQAIGKAVKTVANAVKETVKETWEKVKSVGKSIWNGVKSLFSSIFG